MDPFNTTPPNTSEPPSPAHGLDTSASAAAVQQFHQAMAPWNAALMPGTQQALAAASQQQAVDAQQNPTTAGVSGTPPQPTGAGFYQMAIQQQGGWTATQQNTMNLGLHLAARNAEGPFNGRMA